MNQRIHDNFQWRMERFAELRAAYPERDYEEIIGQIAEEQAEEDERDHYAMLAAQDEERAERYMDAA